MKEKNQQPYAFITRTIAKTHRSSTFSLVHCLNVYNPPTKKLFKKPFCFVFWSSFFFRSSAVCLRFFLLINFQKQLFQLPNEFNLWVCAMCNAVIKHNFSVRFSTPPFSNRIRTLRWDRNNKTKLSMHCRSLLVGTVDSHSVGMQIVCMCPPFSRSGCFMHKARLGFC